MLHQPQQHHHHHHHHHSHSHTHGHQHVSRSSGDNKTKSTKRRSSHHHHHSSSRRRTDVAMSNPERKIVNIQLDIHLDLLCPWCYVEKRSLENAMARFESEQPGTKFQVAYKPFYLYPVLRKGISKQQFTETAFGPTLPAIKEVAAGYGLDISLTGLTGPTRNAHILIALSTRLLSPERQSNLIDRLFHGHFAEGQDLSHDLWLLQLGKKVGLPEDVVRAEFAKGEAGRRIDEQVRRAETEEGIVAVPCVTIQGKYRLGGYQDEDVFDRLFERVWAEEVAMQ